MARSFVGVGSNNLCRHGVVLLAMAFLIQFDLTVADERDHVTCFCDGPGTENNKDCLDGKIRCAGLRCEVRTRRIPGLPITRFCAPKNTIADGCNQNDGPDWHVCTCKGELCNTLDCCDCVTECKPRTTLATTPITVGHGGAKCHCKGSPKCQGGFIGCPNGLCETSYSSSGEIMRGCGTKEIGCQDNVCTCGGRWGCNNLKCCECGKICGRDTSLQWNPVDGSKVPATTTQKMKGQSSSLTCSFILTMASVLTLQRG